MGTHYGIELYFPLRKLAAALNALVPLLDTTHNVPVAIELPNNQKILIPVYTDRVNNPILLIDDHTYVDVTVQFPVDDVIHAYMDDRDRFAQAEQPHLPLARDSLVMRDGKACFPVGNLTLSIGQGSKYARVGIRAVSSSQNPMIRYSPSIHQTLLNVLQQAGGVAALIFLETYEYPVLTDTSKSIMLNPELFEDGEDIDRLTEEIITQIAKL